MTIAAPAKKKNHVVISNETMLTGKLEGKLETAKKLLDAGIEVTSIAEFTDLSFAQIQCLKTHYN